MSGVVVRVGGRGGRAVFALLGGPAVDGTQQRRTLIVVIASSVVTLVVFAVPQATVSRTVQAFEAGPTATPWMLSAMPLGLAVALLPAGAWGDDRGRRRTFATGLALLAAGGLLCAVAEHTAVFVIGRLVQGVGAAAVLTCGLGLIAHVFPPGPGRNRATGMWGASIGGGIAVGGLLPVLVDHGSSWRVSYLITAVLAAALGVAVAVLLVESRAEQARRPDLLGALLLGIGLGCLLAGLIQTRAAGLNGAVLALLAAAAVALAGFVVVELRVAVPMLDLTLFRRRPFLAATTGAIANGAGGTALVSYLPTMVQTGLRRCLLVAALLTLLFAGSSVLSALQVKRLPARWSGRGLLIAGLIGVAAGQIALAWLTPTSSVVQLLPGLLVGGLAYGVLNAALGREAVASVPPGRASVGSGANNTARYVASALGVTLVALIATHDTTNGPVGLIDGWNTAALITATISIVGALVVIAVRPGNT